MLYRILSERSYLDFKEFSSIEPTLEILDGEDIKQLLKILENMKKERLYKGIVHGKYHSEKVLMFTYLLCKLRNIQSPYNQILYDAALYHDIGRVDDSEEPFHGMRSARQIDDIIKGNPLYNNKYHVLLLKAIIDVHSQKDDQERICYLNYAYDLDLLDVDGNISDELVEYSKIYLEMAGILKDCDALDRKRFGDATFESLLPKYLRFDESKQLIDFAEDLNNFYYESMKFNYPEIDESNIAPAHCVHSVGFDFFKINSVLKHGVLSQEEMKKRKLKIPRNFSGGNFDRWISVVDINLLKLSATASREFIERGVSFICQKVKMHEPSSLKNREAAIVTGLPWNKSGHADERYVKNRIAPENIIAINVPTRFISKSILDTVANNDAEHDDWRMMYIYNSLDIKMIEHRVRYYKDKTETSDNSVYWLTILNCLELYSKVLADKDVYGHQNIYVQLNPILEIINSQIGRMLYCYYYIRIGSGGKDITVLDVVNYELQQNKNISYDFCETADGATFFLKEKTKKFDSKYL